MTTSEILTAFLKGNDLSTISDKQKKWLLSVAKKEGRKVSNDGFRDTIYMQDSHYVIKHCQIRAGGYGGTIGTKIVQGKFRLEKMYYIRFDSTGLTEVCRNTDMAHYKREGHAFQIINLLEAEAQ